MSIKTSCKYRRTRDLRLDEIQGARIYFTGIILVYSVRCVEMHFSSSNKNPPPQPIHKHVKNH